LWVKADEEGRAKIALMSSKFESATFSGQPWKSESQTERLISDPSAEEFNYTVVDNVRVGPWRTVQRCTPTVHSNDPCLWLNECTVQCRVPLLEHASTCTALQWGFRPPTANRMEGLGRPSHAPDISHDCCCDREEA
jgi:hypothetical protein